MKKKSIALLMAVVMLFGVVVGGTVAWLRAETGEVVNTFTVGNINIDLKEHDYDPAKDSLDGDKEVTEEKEYKMVPGATLPKDPFVRVVANSEDCWIFVYITKSNNFDTFMQFEIDNNKWELVETNENTTVYRYKTIVSTETDVQTFDILKDNQVVVKTSVTKTQLDALTDATYPTLTFKAYAVQSDNLVAADVTSIKDTDASAIWDIAKTADN